MVPVWERVSGRAVWNYMNLSKAKYGVNNEEKYGPDRISMDQGAGEL